MKSLEMSKRNQSLMGIFNGGWGGGGGVTICHLKKNCMKLRKFWVVVGGGGTLGLSLTRFANASVKFPLRYNFLWSNLIVMTVNTG